MFPRLPCVFHSTQTLTNFCTHANCLLPLCPTCIKIHTAEHTAQRTSPAYQQINHLLEEVATQLQRCSRIVETDLEKVQRLEEERQGWKQRMYEEAHKVRGELQQVLEDWWRGLCSQIENGFGSSSLYANKAEEFKRVLGKQVNTFGRLEDSIYTNKAMRTVIKFKSDDIINKTDLSHTIVTEFLEKCRQREISLKINPDFKTKFKLFLKDSACHIQGPIKCSQIDIDPYDVTNSLDFPSERKQNSSPGGARSRRTDSEQKRHRGIRLVGLENQLQLLDQTKKAMLNRTSKLGVPMLIQKENLSQYRSIKTFNHMSDKPR